MSAFRSWAEDHEFKARLYYTGSSRKEYTTAQRDLGGCSSVGDACLQVQDPGFAHTAQHPTHTGVFTTGLSIDDL